MGRGRRGSVPIGGVWVPFTFYGNNGNGLSRKQEKARERSRETREWELRAMRYVEERKEVMPLVREIVKGLLERNYVFEVRLNQLVEILETITFTTDGPDKYIMMSSAIFDRSMEFKALDRTEENHAYSNLPLFEINVKFNENEEMTDVYLVCGKVVFDVNNFRRLEYSCKNSDGLFLHISGLDKPVVYFNYYSDRKSLNRAEWYEDTSGLVAVYEFSNSKKMSR